MGEKPAGPSIASGDDHVAVCWVLIACIATVVLSVLALTCCPVALWGLHALRYTSSVMVLAGGLVLVAVGWWFRAPVSRLLDRVPSWVVSGLGMLAAGVLMWGYRSRTTFLGDGAFLVGNLTNFVPFQASNPVDYHLHFLLYRGLLAPAERSPVLAYSILSVMAGQVFMVAAWYTARMMADTPGRRLFALLGLVSAGYVLVFFGYVESYALLYACYLFLVLAAVAFLRGRSPLWPVFAVYGLACMLHQTALLMLPGMVYLAVRDYRGSNVRVRRVLRDCAALAVPVGVMLLLLLAGGFTIGEYLAMLRTRSSEYGGLLLPLWRPGGYSLLSPRHLLDYANALLMASPVAALLLPLVLWRFRRRNDAVANFLALAGVPLLVFFGAVDPKIGMFRDWDLFAGAMLVLTPLTVWWLVRQPVIARRPTVSLVVGLTMVFHTFSWVLAGASPYGSARRFADMVEAQQQDVRPSLLGHNYLQLSGFYQRRGDPGQAGEFLRKAAESSNAPRYYHLLGFQLFGRGRYHEAAVAYEKALALDSTLAITRMNLGTTYMHLGRHARALTCLNRARTGLNDQALLAGLDMMRGRCLRLLGRPDEAVIALEQALELARRNQSAWMELAKACLDDGRAEEGLKAYDTAVAHGHKGDPALRQRLMDAFAGGG